MTTLSATPELRGPMTPVMYRVEARHVDLDDTATLSLAPVDTPIRQPVAGQFNMLWAFGIGEAPISLAGADGDVLHHTIRRAGKVSTALWAAREGDPIGMRGPFGTGWGLQAAKGRDILIVAGGIGMAPLRPVVEELVADREEYGRAALLVGARGPDSLLYRDLIESWRSRLDFDVEVTVDTAPPSWRGNVGVVTRLIDSAPVDPEKTTAYVCGPEVMMRFTAQAAADRGIPLDQIFVSLERNMHCAIGHCGHCQLGPAFVCKDGPVLPWPTVEPLMRLRQR
ncbi:MAG: FAD/NAD(P)-binding protein [Acidimicrobiales bacterium]